MKKGIVMIPYAYVKDFNVGINIGHKNNSLDIYMKNCCVASMSARQHCGPNTDVAVVTNIEIASPYKELLWQNGVQTIVFPFDEFCFEKGYKWSLAFYKLCALSKAVHNLEYDYYAYLDTDVYVQSCFDSIWNECDYNIQMYDINHSLDNANYRRLLAEIAEFTQQQSGGITHYGGEFFAANAVDAKMFVEECQHVYSEMLNKGFVTSQGDEFITTIAAHHIKNKVKNAGPYVYRFWTGAFRSVSTKYKVDPVVVLHCPAEKEGGILKLYDRFYSRKQKPSNKVVYNVLHLQHPSLIGFIKRTIVKILHL